MAGLVLALLARPEGLGLHATLTLAVLIAAAAFGANTNLVSESDVLGAAGSAEATLGAMPLTVTLVVAATSLAAFRQATAGHGHSYTALGDAARASVLFGAGLCGVSLLFTSDTENLGTGALSAYDAESLGGSFAIAADAPAALAYGTLTLFVVLAASTLARTDWWPPHLRRAASLLAGPLRAAATLVCLLPVAGLIGYVAVLGFGDATTTGLNSEQVRAGVAAAAGFAVNAGVWLIALGVGAQFGANLNLPESDDGDRLSRLWGPITDTEPGLWVAPVVAVAVLALAGRSASRAAGAGRAPGAVTGWLLVVPVTAAALTFLANLTGHGRVHFDDEGAAGTYLADVAAGTPPVQAIALLTAAAAIVAAALLARRRRRTRPHLIDQQARHGTGVAALDQPK